MSRDSQSDTSRDGSGRVDRADVMYTIDESPATLADEAWYDASHGRRPVGTASDEADVTGPLHRASYQNRRGPND